MTLRKGFLFAASLTVALFAMSLPGVASSYSAVVVYGDSLSDNGNLYKATLGTIPASPPYYQGRYSNGPVAVEQLASKLGVTLDDFAYAGATSGIGNEGDKGSASKFGGSHLPGLQTEVALSGSLLSSPITSSALFVVWGGANDYLISGSPTDAAANIAGIVATLEADGAKSILVPGVPDLGLTPDYFGIADATTYSTTFNAALKADLPPGATYFDSFSLLHQIVNNPGNYGLNDVKDACLQGVTPCANPGQYLFWDGFHPTTAVDSVIASQFLGALATPTPEPSSFVLIGTGISGLTVLMRRRRSL